MPLARKLGRPRIVMTAMLLAYVAWLTGKALLGDTPIWDQFPAYLAYGVGIFLLLALVPDRYLRRLEPVWRYVAGRQWLQLLVLCLLALAIGIFFAARLPLGIDESLVLNAARVVTEDGVGRLLSEYGSNPWTGTRHPPLALVIFGLVMRVTGDSLLLVRFVALLFSSGTVVVTYLIGRTLYGRDDGFLAGLVLLSLPFLYRDGVEARLDILATFLLAVAVYLTLRLLQKPAYGTSVAAGLSIGAALLIRYTAVFIYPVLVVFALADRRFRQVPMHLLLTLLVSFVAVAPWFAFAYHTGLLLIQAETVAWHAATTTQSASHTMKFGVVNLVRYMAPRLGPHSLPLMLWGGYRLLQRRNLSDRLLLIWVAVVSVPVWLTNPDPRYFMPVFPALALAVTPALERMRAGTARILLLGLFLALGMALVYIVGWSGYPPAPALHLEWLQLP